MKNCYILYGGGNIDAGNLVLFLLCDNEPCAKFVFYELNLWNDNDTSQTQDNYHTTQYEIKSSRKTICNWNKNLYL